jgi:hypothetical protein
MLPGNPGSGGRMPSGIAFRISSRKDFPAKLQHKLMFLITEARQRKLSGIGLKERAGKLLSG